MKISKKVILIGHFGVGKTSLVRRFVHSEFSEEYLTTIGVKVDKKVVDFGGTEVGLLLWDIAGESSSVRVPQSYKLGSHGIIYVFDCTRPATYEGIENEIFNLNKELPDVPIVVVGNKIDLITEKEAEKIKLNLNLRHTMMTSAKLDSGVEEMFKDITARMLQ